MPDAYMGKILRVDLTKGEIRDEELPGEEVLRKFLGCFGLGLWYLYREVPQGIAVFDSENPLIFMTGPLTGTTVPCPNNTTLVMKNLETGFTVGRSHSHGFFGPYLKFNGYDGLIIAGKSNKPVYLWIHDGEAEIRDASKIWGKDTHETEELVGEEIGEPKASVAAIGPAGENACAGALIENDKNHSFSHCGGGAIMGLKRLKAIAVHGRKEIQFPNRAKLDEIAKKWQKRIIEGSFYKLMGRAGVPTHDYAVIQNMTGVSALNWRRMLPEFGKDWSKHKITPRPCYRCPIACAYDIEIVSGPHKGYVATLAGGGEALEGSTGIFGITEPGAVFYLTDLCDRLGIEGSLVGTTIAMVFEAFEKGIISTEDVDGLKLAWGDAEVVEKMIRKWAYRDGFGDILARGPKVAAEMIGGDAPNFAIHIKGAALPLHDWRSQWGRMLSFIVSSGAGHAGRTADSTAAEPDAGYTEKTNGLTHKGKAEEVRKAGIIKFMIDSLGICWFAASGIPSIDLAAEAVSALAGWNCTVEELREIGERIMNLERAFNVRHGLTPNDDYNVPLRVIEEPLEGLGKGKALKDYLHGMINEYYELMGWDEKTGKPWRNTLKRLGLEDVSKELWGGR